MGQSYGFHISWPVFKPFFKEFIEAVYNEKRIHSSIGYKTPNEYEKEVKNINIKLPTYWYINRGSVQL